MNRTPIEWSDFTVNPFRFRNLANGRIGHYCVKISPGCKFCYSGAMQKGPYLSGLEFVVSNREKGEIFLDLKPIQDVLRRQKPCRVFWCDMTDMFLDEYSDEWIDICTVAMFSNLDIIHQVLTKRSARMASYWARWMSSSREARTERISIAAARLNVPDGWVDVVRNFMLEPACSKIHYGVSAEDQERADERRQDLRFMAEIGFNTFVSYEPALGPVDWKGWEFLKQGIVGGESGKNARPFQLSWARSAVEQWRGFGVPPFVKQLGAEPRFVILEKRKEDAEPRETMYKLKLSHSKGGDMSEWPPDLAFVREGPFATTPKA